MSKNKFSLLSVEKSYEEILQERKSGLKDLALIPQKTDFGLVLSGGNSKGLIATSAQSLSVLQDKMLKNEALLAGLPEEKKQEWLAVTAEASHAQKTLPRRRTVSEKRGAVLQANRFVTASARYHQAKLEQGHYVGMYTALSYSLKEEEIKLEKMLYKYDKSKAELQGSRAMHSDTFLKEKNLELMELKLVKQVGTIQDLLVQGEQFREEILEWSKIKEELYEEANAAGELWSPDENDGDEGFQEITLAKRHLGNYASLLQKAQSESDISSALNIEGLCLTAIQEGIKSGKLGLILQGLTDDQIDFIWQGVFACKSGITRQGPMIFIQYGGRQMGFVSHAPTYKEVLRSTNSLKIAPLLLANNQAVPTVEVEDDKNVK